MAILSDAFMSCNYKAVGTQENNRLELKFPECITQRSKRQ